jgi:hypothetical protein
MAWRGATLRVPHSTTLILVLCNSSATFAKIYLTQISNASVFLQTPSAITTCNETRSLHINEYFTKFIINTVTELHLYIQRI